MDTTSIDFCTSDDATLHLDSVDRKAVGAVFELATGRVRFLD